MQINFLIVILASLVPMGLGFLWFGPLFGKAWMAETGMTPDKAKTANMTKVFLLSALFNLMVAFAMVFISIHQHHVTSLFFKQPINDPGTQMGALYKTIMDLLGTSYRTFKHGALHGFITGVLLAFPLIGVHALFEQRSFKYIAICAGYWVISMCLMGGIVSAWS